MAELSPTLFRGAAWLVVAMACLLMPAQAGSPPLFGPAWWGSNATTHGAAVAVGPAAAQAHAVPAASAANVAQSILNLTAAARAIVQAQTAQSQANAAALAMPGNTPNGLIAGGLQVDPRVATSPSLWQGAALPTQTSSGGRSKVTVQQNQPTALLNWQTFNVGAHTALNFDQTAGGANAGTWTVLNRVNDPSAQPSRILGSISAPGQVMVMNGNGIIFGAGAQVNVNSLIAAATTNLSTVAATSGNAQLFADQNLLSQGIYSTQTGTGYAPSFTDASGSIVVQAGATIATTAPASAVNRGGFALLMGSSVQNGGSIVTPNGQIILAAGSNFTLRAGYSTANNPTSTTLGSEIAVGGGGAVTNSGIIQSATGDITLAGNGITQAGVLYSTTSVGQRGSIHLLTPASDSGSGITLAPGSVSYIQPDSSGTTAINAQRAANIPGSSGYAAHNSASTLPALNDANTLADRLDQSRIEITTGGTVDFQGGSLTMATGGQIAVAAAGAVTAKNGSVLDVAGSLDVVLPATATTLQVAVQGFQLRDAPTNRDSGALANQTVTVNIGQLVEPNGSNPSAPYFGNLYTAGGLLEVSGELGNVGHTIGEWTAPGGSITLAGTTAPAVVTAGSGAVFNLAGGSVRYLAGQVPTTWLIGSDGRLYNVNTAPAGISYLGVASGFSAQQARWGVTENFTDPLGAPATTFQAGYTVGRDAGSLTLSAPTVGFQGRIDAGVVIGENQDGARPTGGSIDPYALPPTTVPLPGSLVLGNASLAAMAPFATTVRIDDAAASAARDTADLGASLINAAGLGGLSVTTTGSITVALPVTLANGAAVTLVAPNIELDATLTARGGSVAIGNNSVTASGNSFLESTNGGDVVLSNAASIDTRGIFANVALDPTAIAGRAFVNGGSVTIDSSQAVNIAAGSVIDASSGGAVLANHSTVGGRGGSITVIAYDPADPNTVGVAKGNPFTIGGTLRSYGVTGGGALTLLVPNVRISDAAPAAAPGQLVLPGSFFASGFSSYDIDGYDGVTVDAGTQLAAVMPVYQFVAATSAAASGSDPGTAFSLGLPLLYTGDPATAKLTQRAGGSLLLRAAFNVGTTTANGGPITIGANAVLSVDPGQSVRVEGYDQITIDGTITAPGGSISVLNDRNQATAEGQFLTYPTSTANGVITGMGQSIWLGAGSRLDVAAQAATALDSAGRPYGIVPNGGTILLAGNVGAGVAPTDAFIVARPGSVIDASGTSGVIDPAAGVGPIFGATTGPIMVASQGGAVTLNSESGIYLDGALRAASGGAGAPGGTLSVTLATPVYGTANNASVHNYTIPDFLVVPREITIGQSAIASALPASLSAGAPIPDSMVGGARLSADAITAGGFDSVALTAGDSILFDGSVTLTAGRSINLTAGTYGAVTAGGAASVSAPYVVLNGLATAAYGGAVYPEFGGTTPPQWRPSTQVSSATLSVAGAQVDIAGNFEFGISSQLPLTGAGSQMLKIDRAGFAQIGITSSGDLRFLPGPGTPDTTLITPGKLTLTAAQIYPVTGTTATVVAGFYRYGDTTSGFFNAFQPGSLLTIKGTGAVPTAPLTAGGSLTLAAGQIDQGGVLRAPDGELTLGAIASVAGLAFDTTSQPNAPGLIAGSAAFTTAVTLQPGSITSVSMNGLTIPYGGTTDGVNYQLAGNAVIGSTLSPVVTLNGQVVTVAGGATLDLSGGGTLAGVGFIAGRGGSADVLTAPLLALSSSGVVTAPALATNPVYAILPGAQINAAPPPATALAFTGSVPAPGDQITIGAGVPGLPAGTYTLLSGSDALLPGAFRVQLNTTNHAVLAGATTIGNGSYVVNGFQSVANTSFRTALPISVTVSSGAVVRADAQYDEETYSQFASAQAALFGSLRAPVPEDAKTLAIRFPSVPAMQMPGLAVAGQVLMRPAPGGFGGTAVVTVVNGQGSNTTDLEITASGATPTAGAVSVPAAVLNALGASTLSIGADPAEAGSSVQFQNGVGDTSSVQTFSVVLRDGAVLSAPQVFLAAGAGGVTVEKGAVIDTLGRGAPSFDSNDGITYNNESAAVLAVSNGALVFASPTGATGPVSVGAACGTPPCTGTTTLLADGTVTLATTGSVTLDSSTRYGASNISFAVPTVNIGTSVALAQATVPAGLTLDQTILQALLAGDPGMGIPALQQLSLTASKSINFYGSIDLNTIDPTTGRSSLSRFEINTPAIYGAGGSADQVTLTTGTLIWNGVAVTNPAGTPVSSAPPATISAGGAGHGTGSLTVVADQIVFGYGPTDQAYGQVTLNRLIQGFSGVTLIGNQQITGNNKGSLSVSGGDLTLITPLLTGAPGSVNSIAASGNLVIRTPAGIAPATGAIAALGAEIDLAGASISNSSAIVLPSGRLVMQATNDLTLAAGSRLDLSGQAITQFDQTEYSWGGDLVLGSAAGNITQQAGASISFNATGNDAGSLSITATGIGAGQVSLAGTILGGTSAGFQSGQFDVRAQSSDFAALNALLNQGKVFGARSFDLMTGDLTIANGLRAQNVTVSVDGGSLTVAGTIDASGAQPGSIRLSAQNGLTIGAGAVLDVHAATLHLDSIGQPIEAENTADIELTSAAPGSTLTLASGATLDLASPDGVARGTVVLNAPRAGGADIGIAAAGPVAIDDAASVALYGFRNYTPTGAASTVNQAFLNTANTDSTAFINAANANAELGARLAGLQGAAFHLRPGVEIDSSANLTVQGTLDLSGYRYGPNVGSVIGSGEPGALVLRATDNLTVNGSITDGFAPPASGAVLLVAALLPAGSQSWSLELVAGAQPGAADSRVLQAPSALAALATSGNASPGTLTLTGPAPSMATALANWGVIRTGTGRLELLAGGNFRETTPYGIYTAGTQSGLPPGMTAAQAAQAFDLPRGTCGPNNCPDSPDAVLGSSGTKFEKLVTGSNYSANYPDGGGNVLISAQGNVTGDLLVPQSSAMAPTDAVGNWLWRQGAQAAGQPAAWWINFGTYALPLDAAGNLTDTTPVLTGFIGIGALGGGNVTILAGGNAGATTATGSVGGYSASQALDVAVASTGRVVNGVLYQTGGGNITIRVGGALNGGGTVATNNELNGTITDLRGQVSVRAGSIGQVDLVYDSANPLDPRPVSALAAANASGQGGPTVVPGDATVSLSARGDLVLGGAGDPGRLPEQNMPPFATLASGSVAAGDSWFSLWQPSTSITLFSAGGNLTPSTQSIVTVAANGNFGWDANSLATDSRLIYPPTLIAVAASGSIYYGSFAAPSANQIEPSAIELAPSPTGQLELLAAGSIYANQYSAGNRGYPETIDMSGASTAGLPTPLQPAFLDLADPSVSGVNPAVYRPANGGLPSLFAFEPDTATGTLHLGDAQPALVYAGGDIVDLRLGEILTFAAGSKVTPAIWYIAAKATRIQAGGDIVEPGLPPGTVAPSQSSAYTTTGDLVLDNNATDVSTLMAGRDIIYANLDIAGPGLLYVQAGRDVTQADQGVLESIGSLTPNAITRSGGAAITVLAGVGSAGPDWNDFAARYLDTTAAALATFESLPPERQSALLLQIYFNELRDSGREFTNSASSRFKSYQRGREAIATLFPSDRAYQGNITLFGGSGVRSDFGGTISLLAPGGQIQLGVTSGPQPASTAGVLTQGQGDIDIYSTGSVLLGQSRVFTTFGGSIVVWSANGDINAGQGANSTDVFSSSTSLYDAFGNVALAPSVPTTGAGIATLAPIPGIAAGDVDLIAPLGVIDAGEAGIRVSGNANLVALTVVNAANVQVGGRSSGLPVVVAPNVGALSSASSAAAAGNQAAQQSAANSTGANARAAGSIITVDVVGFGNCAENTTTNGCVSGQLTQ